MATRCKPQTGVLFESLALSKQCIRSRWFLYRFQPKSTPLSYIVFKRVHLIFPVAHLVFQVEARFIHSLSNLAYASHIASRIAYHVCIMLFELCTWLIVSFLLVCLAWVEPGDELANKEPVEFSCEDPVNSDNCAGKMIIPSKSLLSLLC